VTIVCVDLDGTINADPGFYKAECTGLMAHGHEVHVLSGNAKAEHALAQLGMVKGRDFTRVSTVPVHHIAAAKVAYMKRVGSTHLVDNSKANIKAARKAGFTGHWHAHPKKKD